VANVRNMSQIAAIEVCLSLNFVAFSNFKVFPFPLSKSKFSCNVPIKGTWQPGGFSGVFAEIGSA
jgi:hypothetical protein